MSFLFCFGLGFSARALAAYLAARGWRIAGTSRSEAGAARLRDAGYASYVYDGSAALPPYALNGATHILVSAPPDGDGDPVLRQHRDDLARRSATIAWLGYLSTTGVYGDRGGVWVSETDALQPSTERGRRRLAAEQAWLDLWKQADVPVHLFQLAGIYGPGRNQLRSVREGTARRIIKPGQVFSRIHVDDIATVLAASIARPNPGAAYNVCDDEPCPPQDVVSYAARLLGQPPPPAVNLAEAQLSPMARSFYDESKRCSNARIKQELGVELRYPSYREGLAALAADGA